MGSFFIFYFLPDYQKFFVHRARFDEMPHRAGKVRQASLAGTPFLHSAQAPHSLSIQTPGRDNFGFPCFVALWHGGSDAQDRAVGHAASHNTRHNHR